MNKDSIPFFADPLVFLIKVVEYEARLKNVDSTLPSWREAHIQVDKLKRMVADFWKKFPTMFSETENVELRRKSAPYRRRLAQQDKKVDARIRRLIEEHVVQSVRNRKVGPRRIRGDVQKMVHRLNKQIRKTVLDGLPVLSTPLVRPSRRLPRVAPLPF